EIPEDLERFGELLSVDLGVAKVKVEREQVSQILATLLDRYDIHDITVHDRPLEDVFAELFDSHRKPETEEAVV
ncbi:MAG TPA: ABC transporter, partial [Planctomycetaceae bacterium]|nr:ABC transporter [Planctomycetaceae bacterium]